MKQCVKDEGYDYSKIHDALLGSHVDDLLGACTQDALNSIKNGVEKHVELDKRGKLETMLGIEMNWEDDGSVVELTQAKLIEALTQQNKVIAKTNLPRDKIYYEQNSQLEPAECKIY